MKKKLTMILASLFLVMGTAWAQTRVLKLTGEQIGTAYPYALTDADAAKVFGLTELTVAVKVNTPSSLSGRKALFCTSDPTKGTNSDAMGTNSHYVALGLNGKDVGYLASCKDGDRFTTSGINPSANDVVLVFVISPTSYNIYVDGNLLKSWTNQFMAGYEIATPKMVKEDHSNAQIYIGGGVKLDNAAFETFNGTITGVEVYDGVLTAEQVTKVFPNFTGYDIVGDNNQVTINVESFNSELWTSVPAGTAWTISMDVENPNGASFNNWGSSIFAIGANAFPEKNGYKGLQFYLQSSANGGKLNAVFDGADHQIDNVTYTGNFSAAISYNGDKQLQIKTTNASGTVAENNYTLNNALAEFSQLSYGLPKGINVKNLMIAPLSHSVDYPTAGTVSNRKYTFTSNKILYGGQCNKIRFTLTESGASYQGGAKRMSFDSFELYDANGVKVELEEGFFTGNNAGKDFGNMLDGNNGTYCAGTWTDGTEDDYFEITLPNGVDLGGAFSFSFVTENETMNAKRFTIDLSYEEIEEVEYTLSVNAPQGEDVTVLYNGEEVASGGTIKGEMAAHLFSATIIPGYIWNVAIDEENRTVTLTYSEIIPEENPEAVVALVNRIGGAGTADKFKFVLDLSINQEQETFVLGAEDGKILIKGSTLSAITTGLGWYLNNVAHINIAWNSLNEKTVSGAAYADLSNLPLPSTEETHVSDAKYRYYLNYCTFGYSMTSWTWKRWQQEIDWMALHGINMPLQIVGLEEVWRRFLTLEENGTRKYGYSDEEAMAFVPGPAYTAWWGMNNLQGWGGTGAGNLIKTAYDGTVCEGTGGVQNKAWFDRQHQLATDILNRQRELGMQPVLPGFSGMVPSNFTEKTGVATDQNNVQWQSFLRPSILDPTAARFAEVAEDYYACLKDVMGESQYYSMDPFHEGGSINSGLYSEAYRAIFDAMEEAKSGSQWVIQQWHWTVNQQKSVAAVPAGRLIVLDLFSDGKPGFSSYGGYTPQDAVFCALPNFGGRSGLMGRLQNMTENYFSYKTQYTSIKGIGAAPEAIEQTPVTYDLIFQLPWMNGVKPNVEEWVNNYAIARYGKDNTITKEAWSLLRQSVLNYGADGIEGPIEDVWASRPNLEAKPASYWGKTMNTAINTYTKARHQMLIDAVYKLLDQKDALALEAGSIYESNYMYDLVEFGSGVMADYAYYLLLGIRDAKNAGNTTLYESRRDAFLALIEDVDAFKGTNLNFRLGKWTQEARDAAKEVDGWSEETQDWYELNNARTLITTWTYKAHGLNDYSYRSWQGLMKDVYLPRWKYFFDNGCTHPNDSRDNYFYFEWNWAHGMTHQVGDNQKSSTRLAQGATGYSYSRDPEGNTVEYAKEMLSKYIIPVTVGGNTHYAYRYLDNDISSMATIPAKVGTTVDLTPYFGNLTGISSFVSDAVEGSVTDLSKVTIKADAADGAHSATITLNDGTKLVFYFSLNPAYNGIYSITYGNSPIFIQYHEGGDNGKTKGYKMISNANTTPAQADKIFTITPSGEGYTLSVQGKYLKPITSSNWRHVVFSDDKAEAGVYLFEKENDLVKLKSTVSNENGANYISNYNETGDGNTVFANDAAGKANSFTITKVDSYPLTISSAGMATLCLPFNVVLPTGMVAYDLVEEKIAADDTDGVYVCTLQSIAEEGDVLKAGTPVIVKANAGDYTLTITMEDTDAKTSLSGSLLQGNFMSQALTQGDATKKFIFANGDFGVGFYMMNDEGTIGANKCWMEWQVPAGANVRSLIIRFGNSDTTDVEMTTVNRQQPTVIYNLAGQRLEAPQKGINIVNGKKVVK